MRTGATDRALAYTGAPVRLNELFDVVFRWAHLIAGIMWIGNSMLFNWLDRNLEHHGRLSPLSQGKIFMVHSGAFYDVEKKLLEPGELPTTLHWFKWQNGFTWMTGIALLVIVYYGNGAAFLVDVNVCALDPVVAITASASSLFIGWVVYDGLWRTVGERNPRAATVASVAMLFGAIYGFTQMFSGRAAYIQTGVLIGTIMTGNVWLCILPSQRSLIAATEAGRPQDPVLSLRAKQRSIHNNYLTFPLLFMMLSNHFPSAYGHHLSWLVLICVMIGGAGVRYFMNIRYRGEGRQMLAIAWLTPAAMMAAIAVGGLVLITRVSAAPDVDVTYPVGFARAQEIIVKRCVPCHSTHPTDPVFPAPPNNVVFEAPDQIKLMVPRIRERAIESKDRRRRAAAVASRDR
ncbi:MAG: urate hydroxylase PuuD [Deltaproteobacteria bacterium]|nr:MAG: urate hydroxylase PuuD [Deltaproteobacteria bacterium]